MVGYSIFEYTGLLRVASYSLLQTHAQAHLCCYYELVGSVRNCSSPVSSLTQHPQNQPVVYTADSAERTLAAVSGREHIIWRDHLPNFPHMAWVNPWYGFQALSKGATR